MKQETKIRIWIAIVIVVILGISVAANAQNWKRGLAIAGYHVGTVAIGAVADGLYDDGYKNWAHALHAVEIGAVIGGPFIWKIERSEALSYILSYGFIRFSLFDGFYNATRDLPLLSNGTTSAYDRFMNTVPPHGRAWMKSWSLVAGFSIPITSLKW